MHLFLVRHGQTAWNTERRLQGHTDIALDEVGLSQARAVARAMKNARATRILSSDLQRCRATADQIGSELGLVPFIEPCLKERGFGVLEGRTFEDFRTALEQEVVQSGLGRLDHCPEGGESLRQVWARIAELAAQLTDSHEPSIVVSHGGTLGLLLARLIGAGPEAAHAFRFSNASITELLRRPDRSWAIERLNDRAHLEEARDPARA